MIIERTISQYKNIPDSFLKVSDKITIKRSCLVEMFKYATLEVPGFALVQFIEGASEWASDHIKEVSVKQTRLLAQLAISVLTMKPSIKIVIDYEQLVLLKTWLEIRMKHCENERDNRTLRTDESGKEIPDALKFNPDSYIAMKLLLLDIRELMLGSFIILGEK